MNKTPRPTIERLYEVFEPDFEKGELTWKINHGKGKKGSVAGYRDATHDYVRTAVDGHRFMVHVILWAMKWGRWPDTKVRDRRLTSKPYRNNKYGLRGVRKYGDKCRADIRVNGKNIFLGIFEDPKEAHNTYCDAASMHFASFAIVE